MKIKVSKGHSIGVGRGLKVAKVEEPPTPPQRVSAGKPRFLKSPHQLTDFSDDEESLEFQVPVPEVPSSDDSQSTGSSPPHKPIILKVKEPTKKRKSAEHEFPEMSVDDVTVPAPGCSTGLTIRRGRGTRGRGGMSRARGRGRPTSQETTDSYQLSAFHNFLRLKQLFPEIPDQALHVVLEECSNDFTRIVDNVLFARQHVHNNKAERIAAKKLKQQQQQKEQDAFLQLQLQQQHNNYQQSNCGQFIANASDYNLPQQSAPVLGQSQWQGMHTQYANQQSPAPYQNYHDYTGFSGPNDSQYTNNYNNTNDYGQHQYTPRSRSLYQQLPQPAIANATVTSATASTSTQLTTPEVFAARQHMSWLEMHKDHFQQPWNDPNLMSGHPSGGEKKEMIKEESTTLPPLKKQRKKYKPRTKKQTDVVDTVTVSLPVLDSSTSFDEQQNNTNTTLENLPGFVDSFSHYSNVHKSGYTTTIMNTKMKMKTPAMKKDFKKTDSLDWTEQPQKQNSSSSYERDLVIDSGDSSEGSANGRVNAAVDVLQVTVPPYYTAQNNNVLTAANNNQISAVKQQNNE